MTACAACAADNPPAARFCNQCGARLDSTAPPAVRSGYTPRHLAERILKDRSALRGEKKRVTVLFCDIKGSTRLAQQAGAEAWHGVLDRFFALLGAAVHRYEGTINQYTGDGIMALFGAPLSLEDHAQRACLAALEMQRTVRAFGDELRLSQGLNLTLRVGINSGEVIVGSIGDDLRMDYTAQGHTVHLAARMEHICEPGHIYLSSESAQQVQGYFRLRSLGRMTVAGVDEPVEVHDLEDADAQATRLGRSLARGASPLVGREPELTRLQAALAAAKAGQGQVITVRGEAGIGKSRLCHEFLQHCAAQGFEVHTGTGVAYAGAWPLHPIRHLALSRLGLVGRSNPAEIRRLVAGTLLLEHPEHAAALPSVFDFLGAGEATAAAPDTVMLTRAKLFELLAEFLPCPGEAPLVLLLEDLHFIDAASSEFLHSLANSVRDHRTLLLLNYRPDYADDWLRPLAQLQVEVAALDATQLTQLALTRLGHHPSVNTLAAELGQRAGGNPFFVEEAVQALVDAGRLHGERGHYQLPQALDAWVIPDSVHALLAARIDRLPEQNKALLQAAAVIGEAFPAEHIATLLQWPVAQCEAVLGLLVAQEFLRLVPSDGPSQFEFRHTLMLEVAESLLLDSQRQSLHARIAALMEENHPADAPGHAASVCIAYHWAAAQQWAKAGEWNLQAARWAGTRDMGITTEQFQLALKHLDRAAPEPRVIQHRIAARAALIRMAQFMPVPRADVERAFAEGQTLAAEANDVVGAAEMTISYGNEMLHRADAAAAVQLHAEAVHYCLTHGETGLIKRFRMAILLSHFSAGQPREGIALVDSADGGAWRREPIGEDNFVSRAFHSLLLGWMGDLRLAKQELQGALDYAQAQQRQSSWMHSFFVDLAWQGAESGAALVPVLHHAQQGVANAAAGGGPFFSAIAGRALGMALCLVGRAAEAIPLLEQLTPISAPQGLAPQFEANHLATLARAYRDVGRHDDATACAERAIASAEASGSRVWEIHSWLLWLQLPVRESARRHAAQGLQRTKALIDASGVLGFMPWWQLAQAHWSASPDERAEWLREAAAGFVRIGAAGLPAAMENDALEPAPPASARLLNRA